MKINSQRPYSSAEIKDLFDLFLVAKRLSGHVIYHKKCGHQYRPRKGSFKELFVILGIMTDSNCSVCFMQDHVPFSETFQDTRNIPENIQQLNSFINFYTWLYRHID